MMVCARACVDQRERLVCEWYMRVCKSERDNSRRIWWGFALIIFLYHALIILLYHALIIF